MMTKDELLARHLARDRITVVKDGIMYFCMGILCVAARRMKDGAIRYQADVWSGVWDQPQFTVNLEDIVSEGPMRFQPKLHRELASEKHWLTEAMENQTPVWIDTYGTKDIRGWRVIGVTVDRWPDGRFAIGAECIIPDCPNSVCCAAVWQIKLDREEGEYAGAGEADGAESVRADVARDAS